MVRREFLQAAIATLGFVVTQTASGFGAVSAGAQPQTKMGFIGGGTPLDIALRNGLIGSVGASTAVEDLKVFSQPSDPSYRAVVTALTQWSGRGAIAVLQSHQRALFEEALFDVRAKVRFRGHHVRDGAGSPIRHDVLELPASVGLSSILTNELDWPIRLGQAAGLVAASRWSGVLPPPEFAPAASVSIPAPFALSTYVITL